MHTWILALLGCWGDKPVAGAALGPGDDRPVWMFRYEPQGWVRSEEPLAHSVSSLGLGIVGDRLVLSMQCFWGDCGSESKRHEIGPPVHTLSTMDLSSFEPGMIRLVDPEDRVPIDTEVREENGVSYVWYYGTQSGVMGDPAAHADAHRIYRARVDGSRLVDPELMMVAPGLADPAPLIDGDKTLLFLTTLPGRSIGMASGRPLRVQRSWMGVSVPHAMVVEDEIWLWAQRVRAGKMIPVRARSRDGGTTWTEWDEPLPMDGLTGCGNPVGVVYQGVPVVFCVTEPVGAPRP